MGCSICVISLSVALGLQVFKAITKCFAGVKEQFHRYSSYELNCNIWNHDYKVTLLTNR